MQVRKQIKEAKTVIGQRENGQQSQTESRERIELDRLCFELSS